MHRLGSNVPWGDFNKQQMQALIDDSRVGVEFVLFLRNLGRVEYVAPEFQVWRTVTLGLHPTTDKLTQALKAKLIRMDEVVRKILSNLSIESGVVDIDLVKVNGRALGITRWVTYEEVINRASMFGLEKCPAEVGAALRDQYSNQPQGEYLYIASGPINDSDYGEITFMIAKDEEEYLSWTIGDLNHLWGPHTNWIFTPRKK